MSGIKMQLALKRKVSENKMTVDYLTETASKYPNKVAIHAIGIDGEPDRTLTFRELERYVNKVANYFKGCGLKKGDTVALFLENSPESYALYLGLAKIGVISALININLRRESLLHCIKVSECVGVVFSASLSDAISTVLQELEPAIKDICYSVCGESSVPEAKSLEVELENVSSEPPPPVKDKSVNGKLGSKINNSMSGVLCMCHAVSFDLYALYSDITNTFSVSIATLKVICLFYCRIESDSIVSIATLKVILLSLLPH